MKARWLGILCLTLFLSTNYPVPTFSQEILVIADDSTTPYSRTQFRHWIDADKDGCDTRAEVLIQEALVKPKIEKKCKLKGGKWVSQYDGKIHRKAASLDIDHLVSLAEAWRSGASNWSAEEREQYANDLNNPEVLLAVTRSANRSKGDRDLASWMPKKSPCKYIQDWISIKIKYSLTVDFGESQVLRQKMTDCSISGVTFSTESSTPIPSPTPSSAATPSPTPTQTLRTISPGAFCSQSEEGQMGQSAKGIIYTCKISSTENRLRWRQ